MTILIIARHGNTFESGETPRRVGARTDMNLTAKGLEQGKNLGTHLKTQNLLPIAIFTSHLKRTIQTAQEIMKAAELPLTPQASDIFNEIDYGPDENKTEDEVIARIGGAAIKAWEEHATLPDGWSPDANTIIENWKKFAQQISKDHPNDIILVVTSNGIARFALNLPDSRQNVDLKLATGAYGILEHTPETGWTVKGWNIRP
jgi:probable phosphoglycerate mutase